MPRSGGKGKVVFDGNNGTLSPLPQAGEGWVRVFFLLPGGGATKRRKKTLTFPPLRGGPLPLPQAGEGLRQSEPLANHFLALGPECPGALGVEGIVAHATADAFPFLQVGDVAILAILPADFRGIGNDRSPD